MNSREVMAMNFKASKSLIKSMDFNVPQPNTLELNQQKKIEEKKVSGIVSYLQSDKKYSKEISIKKPEDLEQEKE